MSRIFYIRISDDKQDTNRQVDGLRDWAVLQGETIPTPLWDAALKKLPVPDSSPVQWDYGSRDMAETRPAFQKLIRRISNQNPRDPNRITEFVIYEFDRFGVADPDEWGHYRWQFRKSGCRIVSALKGDLMGQDAFTYIQTLFDSLNSREEQRKIAGRVADQKVRKAQLGEADTLGGTAPFGYDRGCFDRETKKLLFRVHYLELSSKLKRGQACERLVIQYDDGGNEIRRAIVLGEGDTPKPTKSQVMKLVPSIDPDRIRAVRLIFTCIKEEYPAISILGICKRLASMGLTMYQGKSFHYDAVMYLAQMPDYYGFRSYNKRRAGRHKTHVPGKGQQDIPEDEKGKYLHRPIEEWVLPPVRRQAAFRFSDN